jgi:hypothetical protein
MPDRLEAFGDLPSHSVLVDDLSAAMRTAENDLQIGLKPSRRDMVQMSARRTEDVSPIVTHGSTPSYAGTSVRIVEVELENVPHSRSANQGPAAIMLNADGSAKARSDICDLAAGIGLPDTPTGARTSLAPLVEHRLGRGGSNIRSSLKTIIFSVIWVFPMVSAEQSPTRLTDKVSTRIATSRFELTWHEADDLGR